MKESPAPQRWQIASLGGQRILGGPSFLICLLDLVEIHVHRRVAVLS